MANQDRFRSTFVACASLCALLALSSMPACAPKVVGTPEKLPPYSQTLIRCSKWFEGSFTNEKQVKKDPTFPKCWLHHVRIWPERSDGIWFYVEETHNGNTQEPMRQYVYQLTDDIAGGVLIESYTLPGNPLRFASSWRTPRDFNQVDPFNLNLCGGCNIQLTKQGDGTFSGTTTGTSCATKRNGASYQTQSLSVASLEIKQWIRGYDAYGNQVFGSQKGATLFDRADAAAAPESIKPGSDNIPDIGPYTPKGKK